MARPHAIEYFKAFRFFILFGDPAYVEVTRRLGGRSIPASAVWTDPFDPSKLCISAGHAMGVTTLREHVEREDKRRQPGQLSVWLLGADMHGSRRFDATYRYWRWVPLNVDAREDATASEVLIMYDVVFGPPEDAP